MISAEKYRNYFKKITESKEGKQMKEFTNHMSYYMRLELPEFLDEKIPNVVIPNFNLEIPKLKLPEFEIMKIDYKKIKKNFYKQCKIWLDSY